MTATQTTSKLADKFRKLAEKLPDRIAYFRRPMTQNPTPKRQKEYASRCIDGDNLERARLALLALADAYDRDAVPVVLLAVRTKDEVATLVRFGIDHSGGYYSIHSTGEYQDTSPEGRALQTLLGEYKARGGHVADEAAIAKKRELERLIDKVRFVDIPGFYPTPDALIDFMLQYADLKAGQSILEPSAGIGSICDRLTTQFPSLGLNIVAIEIIGSLVDVLRAKGYTTIHDDFLQQEAGRPHIGAFDRIIMNPPFENGQDIEHIRHAFDLLKPGGRLVSLASAGIIYRTDRKYQDFREWADLLDASVMDVSADAFKGPAAFRQTGVNCKMVVIQKS